MLASPKVEVFVPLPRLALCLALIAGAFSAPLILTATPAHAQCVSTSPPLSPGDSVLCATTDDTNGFSFTGDITDFTVNEGFTVDDSVGGVGDIAGINSGIVNINGIGSDVTGTLLNNGTIRDLDGAANAVYIQGLLNRLINNGTISGGRDGIDAGDIGTLINSGTITGGDDGINASDIGTLINSGTINADNDDGIQASNGSITNLTNSGTISAGHDGIYVLNGDVTNLTNSGTISGGDDGIEAFDGSIASIEGNIINLTNSGTISGGDDGIEAGEGSITNLTNSGTISAGDDGIEADVVVSLINSGIISGGDYAIVEGGAGDTVLTLNAGSILIGGVDLGGGVNTLNIGEGLSLNSTFESDAGASVVQLGTTGGHLVALVPVSTTEVRIVAVDLSAFASFDDALAALTSGFGSAVQSRQAAVRSDPALGFSSRFAAAEQESLAAFADLNLDDEPHLNPNRFWIEGFGAYRQDDSDRVGGEFDHLSGGLVAGVDVPLDALTSVGVMAGFAASTSQNETDTQETDTMSYYGGVYASTQALGLAWDASLTVGYSDYDAERITANNLVANGLETARADFGGWFINPQVTMTREAANPLAGSGIGALMATNTLEQILTLSYAGLFMDGYTETGTTNPLTLDDRSVHVASARAALALPFERIEADGALTTLRLIGGVEARTQFGDDSVSGMLLGQSVSTTLDDDDFTAGAFVGLAGEYQTTTGMTAYANAEGLIESDASWQLSATAGLRIAF